MSSRGSIGSTSKNLTVRLEGMAFIKCLRKMALNAELDNVGWALRSDSFKRSKKRVGSLEGRRVASSNSQ